MAKQEIHEGGWGKSIFNKGKWYFLSSLLTKGLGIILIPIYTAHLSPYDYGILQNLNAIAFVLPMLLSLALDAAFGRFYHDIKKDKRKISQLFSTLFWFIAGYGILILALVLATAKWWLTNLLDVPIFPYAYLSFIPALITQLGILGQRYFEQSLRTRGIMVINIIAALVNGGLSVILLTRYDMGVIARLNGIAMGALFTFGAYFIYFIKSGILKFTFSPTVLKSALVFSIPLVPSLMGSWLAHMTDKLVIAHYIDLDSSGLYAFAGQMALIVYLIGDASSRVINPITMSGLVQDKERTKQKMAQFALFFWGFMLWLVLCILLFSNELVTILSDKAYNKAHTLVPIIAFAYVLGAQYRFPSQIISYYKKTWILTSGAIIMGLSNLGLNVLLVPKYGYQASAWTTILATLIYTIWLFLWSHKLEPLKIEWNKYIYILLLFIFTVIVVQKYVLISNITMINIVIKSGISILIALIISSLTNSNIFKILKSKFTTRTFK